MNQSGKCSVSRETAGNTRLNFLMWKRYARMWSYLPCPAFRDIMQVSATIRLSLIHISLRMIANLRAVDRNIVLMAATDELVDEDRYLENTKELIQSEEAALTQLSTGYILSLIHILSH